MGNGSNNDGWGSTQNDGWGSTQNDGWGASSSQNNGWGSSSSSQSDGGWGSSSQGGDWGSSSQSNDWGSESGGRKGGAGKALPVILGVVGGIILVAAIAAIGIFSGLFLSSRGKVEKAILSTCNIKSELFDVSKKAMNIASSNSIKAEFDADVAFAGGVSGAVIVDGKDKQIVVSADITKIPEFTMRAGIDSKAVSLEVPDFSDKLFVYNYKDKNKDGLIADELGDQLDAIDAACEFLYEFSANGGKLQSELRKAALKQINELDFEKADPKSFKIDNNKVKCGGYSTTIDEDFCMDFIDEIKDVYEDEMGDLIGTIEEISGEDFDEIFDDMKDEFEGMDDIIITFYIYKGKLADINIEADGDELDILFKGGDYRAQNVVIEENGNEVASFSASTKKDKEIYTLEADGEELEIAYNTKSGLVTLSSGRQEFSLKIETTGNSITINLSEIPGVSGSITISKDAKIEKYENKDKFDIGNADKYDIEDLVYSLDPSIINMILDLF